MAKEEASTLSLDHYAPEAKGWVIAAQALADARGHAEITPLHLLAAGLEQEPGVQEVLRRAGVPIAELGAAAERALAGLPRSSERAYLSARLLDLLRRAEREAKRQRAAAVGLEHLLGALAQEVRGPASEVLGAFGLEPGALERHHGVLRRGRGSSSRAASTASPPGTRDFTAEAAGDRFGPVIGREPEVRRLLTILERRHKSHPLLVGEAGVGKSAVVVALARRIGSDTVPPRLAGARILEIDTGALVAGARLRGEVEERVHRLMKGAAERPGHTLLLARGFEQLFGGGAVGAAVGDVLRPALEEGLVRLMGTTTPEGLRRLQDRDPGVLRWMTLLPIDEPPLDTAVEMLRAAAARYEGHHAVRIGDGAITAAATLARRYLQDRFLPDSALDLLDEAAAACRIARAERAPSGANDAELTEEGVAAVLARWTGIPVHRMLEGEAEKLLEMERRLERRIVGQDDAIRALSRAVRRGRVGLRDPRRPIGSFLFLGPSGVGKTELAKALAELLFDDEAALTRLDMSEFMERHMAQRLVGAPPGYVDSEQGGFLTEAVRRRPYSVLLFDEVEKAHRDVFNLLLQVLEDGRLTDGRGRLADFTNTVVIMTSNIGSERILEASPETFDTDAGREALRAVLLDELRELFRPELLNRIDDVIVFRALTREHLRKIVDIQLAGVQRLLDGRRLRLDVDDAAKDLLVELGYEPAFGARPLRRAVIRRIQDPVAEALLRGEQEDAGTIGVGVVGGELTFGRVPGDLQEPDALASVDSSASK